MKTMTTCGQALVKDEQSWTELCGPAVLRCLRRLGQTDPEGLRLSRAGSAAIALGLPLKEVHTAMPSRLRFGPMAQPWGQQNTGHTASWNPESSRFHIFSNLFHIVLLVTVDFPDDVGWFACLSLPAINAVTAGPGAKNLFLDLHKRGIGPEGAARLGRL